MTNKEKTVGISLLHGLSISHRGKLVWTSTFEALQSFVREALNLSDGNWSTPGGHAKFYEDKDIALRWYSDTKSITLGGKLAKEFVEKASISQNLANEGTPNPVNEAAISFQITSSESKDQNLHKEDNNALFENLINSKATQWSQEDNTICNSDDFKLNLMTCVENMNRKLDFLINEVNVSKNTRLNELTVLEEALDGLKKENLKVMKENIDLRVRYKYLSLIMSDLSVKLKDQEQKIKSLITAIKLLQDDDKQNQPEDRQTAFWHTIPSSEVKSRVAPTYQPNIGSVETSSQFELLSDDENDDTRPDIFQAKSQNQGKQRKHTCEGKQQKHTSEASPIQHKRTPMFIP